MIYQDDYEFIIDDKAQERIDSWKNDATDFEQPELVIEKITPNWDSNKLTIWLKLKEE